MAAVPAVAMQKALDRAGLTTRDINLFEVNEAFAAVPLVCARILDLDLERVNVNGGAVAIGHPIGASAAHSDDAHLRVAPPGSPLRSCRHLQRNGARRRHCRRGVRSLSAEKRTVVESPIYTVLLMSFFGGRVQ